MAKVSITEAAQLAGKDRTTIHRHIKKGKLSKGTDEEGNPVIDTSELERVYGSLNMPATEAETLQKEVKQQPATSVATVEIEVLKVKLEAAERERDSERERRQEAERREREARADAVELREMLKAEQQNIRLLAPPVPASETETKKASGKRSMGQRLAAWWDGVG